ncbi:DUF2252 domain-containing protein [Roseomonas eburnea]|uniref:DUF2252 domain-containing protein n=1 Tax=Neoroseomonas eburnea TaxID=1346889 RepID=A0A9X9XJ75_9PROT|nr:DUF2252 family protein [Neoroseomonas eburnea]MBR0683761.1 DUF2252 domain-containing protein [Neoroseomonas eburnea]
MDDIVASTRRYEAWLGERLGAAPSARDLAEKHEKMAKDRFAFLRATYWRWCERAPDFDGEPRVLAVGDIHAENFGTWRDVEGRLVFGVNDHDEAAPMPWPHDLVRLVTSVLLGAAKLSVAVTADQVAAKVLDGYGEGMEAPRPLILDGTAGLWERLVLTSEKDHTDFWDEAREEAAKDAAIPPPRYGAALEAAFPPGAEIIGIYARDAGLGSRGRPRYAALAEYRGGLALREVKALVPSAWTRRPGEGPEVNRSAEAALGRHRSPDPWFAVTDGIARRRLSPNNRKIEFPKKVKEGAMVPPLEPVVLKAMGQDLAAIHSATPGARAAVRAALAAGRQDPAWLAEAAARMADAIAEDQAAWKAHMDGIAG